MKMLHRVLAPQRKSASACAGGRDEFEGRLALRWRERIFSHWQRKGQGTSGAKRLAEAPFASHLFRVHLAHLRLRDFRNYARLDVDFSPGFHLLLGDNAQGKTNVLESIYLMATLRSFRGVGGAQIIRQGQKGYFVGGTVVARGEHEIKMYWSALERKLSLDGQVVRRLAEYLGVLRVVVFCTEDLQLIKGTSRLRRRFPPDAWTDAQRVLGIAACVFDGEIFVLHFHPRREALVRKEKRHLDGLRETPLTPAIPADFVLEKGVECPVDALDDFLRKQQPKLVGIGPVRLHRCFLFLHHHFLFLWSEV
jgi:hypothetical protein